MTFQTILLPCVSRRVSVSCSKDCKNKCQSRMGNQSAECGYWEILTSTQIASSSSYFAFLCFTFHRDNPRSRPPPSHTPPHRTQPACDVRHMGSVKKSNDSSIQKFLGINVRVFWCLALICALEVRCRLAFFLFEPPTHPRSAAGRRLTFPSPRRSYFGHSACSRASLPAPRRSTTPGRRYVCFADLPEAASGGKWSPNSDGEERKRSARVFSDRPDPRLNPPPPPSQVNLKSTTGQTVPWPTPPIDYRSLELAWKVRRARTGATIEGAAQPFVMSNDLVSVTPVWRNLRVLFSKVDWILEGQSFAKRWTPTFSSKSSHISTHTPPALTHAIPLVPSPPPCQKKSRRNPLGSNSLPTPFTRPPRLASFA